MATEYCPHCKRPFLLLFVEDKMREPSPVTIICPYDNLSTRTEVTTRRYFSKALDEASRPRADQHPLP